MSKLFGFFRDDPYRRHRLLPIGFALVVALIAALALAAGLSYLGFVLFPGAGNRPPGPLDIVKTAFAAVAGIGGVVALVVAYRRQRIAERGQLHTEYAELYGQAAEQLGHDKAAVRLAGLYSLERLGQDHPQHRQTVVDVICAYLRMPFHDPDNDTAETQPTPPQDQPASPDSATGTHAEPTPPTSIDPAEAKQELQVRLTAQRLLTRHLHTGSPGTKSKDFPDTYWEGINIDLTDAYLITFVFTNCRPHNADFTRATFTKSPNFQGAHFSGDAWFEQAQFNGGASFEQVQFDGDAWFREAWFSGGAGFREAWFKGGAKFSEAQFDGDASFERAQFAGYASFERAQFNGGAGFRGAWFKGGAKFSEAWFKGGARFAQAWFSRSAWFEQAQFAGYASFERAQFAGYASFERAQFVGNAGFSGAWFSEDARFEQAQFAGDARFAKARFSWGAGFSGARFSGNARFEQARFDRQPSFNEAAASHPNDDHVWPDSWQVEPMPSEEKMGRLTRRAEPDRGHTSETPDAEKE